MIVPRHVRLPRDHPLGADARIALDVGATHLRSAIVDGSQLIEPATLRSADDPVRAGTVERIVHTVRQRLADRPELAGRPVGIGIAAAIRADGSVSEGTALGLPEGYPLGSRLAAELSCPIVLENDANLAALGEHRYGAGRGSRSMVLLSIGTNLGMGIVLDGRVYGGVSGAAGEIGTVAFPVIPGTEPPGAGGPGASVAGLELRWIEGLYGGRAMQNAYTQRHGSVPDPSIRVVHRARAGDAIAEEIVREALSAWAYLIATTASVLDPGTVVIGGGIAADLREEFGRLQQHVRALLPTTTLIIRPAALSTSGGLVGAGAAAVSPIPESLREVSTR